MTIPAAGLVLFLGFWFPSKTLYVSVVPSLWINGDSMRAHLWSQLNFTRFFLMQGWSQQHMVHQGILLQQLPTRVVSHLSINRACHRNVAQCIRTPDAPGTYSTSALSITVYTFALALLHPVNTFPLALLVAEHNIDPLSLQSIELFRSRGPKYRRLSEQLWQTSDFLRNLHDQALFRSKLLKTGHPSPLSGKTETPVRRIA